MARIRTVKPELWTDEGLAECSPMARLLFIASLNFADDNGNLQRSPRQLKAQALPYDSVDCETLILELLDAGMLIEYQVTECKYLHIKSFLNHQKIDRPSKCRIPLYDESMRVPLTLDEDSTRARQGRKEVRQGKESNGKDGGKDTSAHSKNAPTDDPPEFRDFKLAYPARAGDQGWRKALRAAHARIAEGYSWLTMIDGAIRYREFLRSTGNEGTAYVKQACTFLGPDLAFMEPWKPPATKTEQQVASNLNASVEWLHAKR